MAGVSLRNLRKSYGEDEIIHGVSCDIADGEFAVIVGPSGCGKSTLLRMVAGLEEITSGEIAIGDRVVNRLEPADRNIAMVFQNYALYPHMTVFGNMSYGLKIRRLSRAEIAARVNKAADILELGDLLKRKPRQLSGGQRQRVAMGRAIVREPSVFLFDEPLSNLDAKLRAQMRVEIKKLHKSLGITSLYVTHDQVEAMTLGDRLIVMRDGNVEQVGTPLELYDRPATTFVAGFIGSPTMNFADAHLAADRTAIDIPGSVRVPVGPVDTGIDAGAPLILGIRPEHLELADGGKELLHLKIDLVEELGADTLVHGHFGQAKGDLTARLPGVRNLKPGTVLPLSVKAEHMHFFDRETGQRLPRV